MGAEASLVDHPTGGYRFLPGIAPYSRGVVAAEGHELVRIVFRSPPPYRVGLDLARSLLEAQDRPPTALCSVELRSPRPFDFPGFREFNAGYEAILAEWGLPVDGANPVARTNVAPAAPENVGGLVGEPSLYAFAFARPRPEGWSGRPSFVVAGAGELPEGSLEEADLVRGGNTSPEAIAEKARFVIGLMEDRLAGLGVSWGDASSINVYTVHGLDQPMRGLLWPAIGSEGSLRGATWVPSRPPIVGVEFEMDVRGVSMEMRI